MRNALIGWIVMRLVRRRMRRRLGSAVGAGRGGHRLAIGAGAAAATGAGVVWLRRMRSAAPDPA